MDSKRGTLGDRAYRWFFNRVVLRLAHKTTHRGIDISQVLLDDDDPDKSPQLICAAIDLVAMYSPRQFQRLQRDVPRIHVGHDTTSLGAWVASIRTCLLSRRHLETDAATVGNVASILVHEAMHARLDNCGIPYDEAIRFRVERQCMKAEITLGERLPEPDGSCIIRQAKAQIARDPAFWTDASFRQQRVHALSGLGVPHWLARLLVFVFRRRAT